VGQLHRLDLPGGDVVAVAEAAREHEDLVVLEQFRVLAEAVDVEAVGPSTCELEGELGLEVAVGARRAEDQDLWRSHDEIPGNQLEIT